MKARRIFSGIQPTGIPHLGNYLGAIANWLKLQNDNAAHSLFFSVVGLHALTVPRDPALLARDRQEMLASLLAVGLNPDRCTIFHQEQIPEHTELFWMLSCITSVGLLQRMTTWKSKLALIRNSSTEHIDESALQLGLLSYPVLQAADILLYRATHVPVGEDQRQHIELSRDIVDIFNSRYKKYRFPMPHFVPTPQAKILSLRDPEHKMSKSDPQTKSRILLTDSQKDIAAKIKSAVTDSGWDITYNRIERPGISNLIDILVGVEELEEGSRKTASSLSLESQQNLEEQHAEKAHAAAKRYKNSAELKEAVTDAVQRHLQPIQEELLRIKDDHGYLESVERKGREKAAETAQETMKQVKSALGFSSYR